MDVLRIGLLGAGGIARTHAESLRAIDGVRVVGVLDPARDRAEALAADHDAVVVDDLGELLDRIDAVYVCSPPTFHREHVEAAAAAGVHVYCEKPIGTTLDDGRAIGDAVATGGIHAMVGFNNRFRPTVQRWRALVRDGALGRPLAAWILRVAPSLPAPNANWRTTPGLLCGVTIESASHDIDLVRWTFGEIETVTGATSSALPELEGFDDTLAAVLQVAGGPPVTLTISWSSAISTSSRGITGTEGAACLVGPDMWTLSELRRARAGEPETIEPIDPAEGTDLGYRAASEHFVACLREDREPEVTVADGLAALEVSLALKSHPGAGYSTVSSRGRPRAS